jgi:glycolate oxidase
MPERFMTLPEIERAAKKVLPSKVWDFGKGGAETETTLRRNRRALRRLAIRQRVLVDVRHVDLSTTFWGCLFPCLWLSLRWGA